MRNEAKTWWLFSGPDVASSYFFKRKSVSHLNHEPSFRYRCYRQWLLTWTKKYWNNNPPPPLTTTNQHTARTERPFFFSIFRRLKISMGQSKLKIVSQGHHLYFLETLRFSRLNERNVSLVAICAVILVMQRLSSSATIWPDTRCARSPEGGYAVFSI